jgi:hypothetical protein
MGDHVLYIKLTPEEEWRRAPGVFPGSARNISSYDQCIAVRFVLRMLGYPDAIVEAREPRGKNDPLHEAAWKADPFQKRDCPRCDGWALIPQPDGRWRCLFCHLEMDDAPEER